MHTPHSERVGGPFGKRKYVRSPAHIACTVTIADETVRATVDNLSSRGAGMFAPCPLAVGDMVEVRFFLRPVGEAGASQARVSCKAVIRWARPAGAEGSEFGVEFVSISSEDQARLQALLTMVA